MNEDKSRKATDQIPTLVEYCQRMASMHIDSISGLGSDISYELASPILDFCSANTLKRIEDSSPHLKADTNSRWEVLCNQDFVIELDKYLRTSREPKVWRELYEELEVARERKLEEARLRLRNSRLDEEQKQRQRNVMLTDPVPPMKKLRPWGAPTQPKTLFQKTKSDASKAQRLRLSKQGRSVKTERIVANGFSAKPSVQFPSAPVPGESPANPNPRVVVRAVAPHTLNRLSLVKHSTDALPPSSSSPKGAVSSSGTATPVTIQDSPRSSCVDAGQKLVRSMAPRKKSPTSALFIPKSRARKPTASGIPSSHLQQVPIGR